MGSSQKLGTIFVTWKQKNMKTFQIITESIFVCKLYVVHLSEIKCFFSHFGLTQIEKAVKIVITTQ